MNTDRLSRSARVLQGALSLGLCLITGILVAVLGPGSGGVPASATADAHSSAGRATTARQLVQEYLAALGPAGTTISRTEPVLRELRNSGSAVQIETAVAPLRPVLAPLEALLASPGPPTRLEALGPPTKQGCITYRTVAQGAHLDVGGRLYDSKNGFQVSTDCSGYNMLGWALDDAYTSLSAQFGEDGLDPQGSQTLAFKDSTNTPIPFTYDGKLLFAVGIPSGRLVTVTVTIAHEAEVKIVLSGGNGGVVDVYNDRVS